MFWESLTAWILGVAAPIAGRILVYLGFYFVSYEGFFIAIAGIKSYVFASVQTGLPISVLQIMSLLGVDKGLNIIFSAFVAGAVLKGWKTGAGGGVKKVASMGG